MQQFLELIRSIDPILFGALGFLCGTLLGNWIAIGRDKRQEFNAAANPIRAEFISVRDGPSMSNRIPTNAEVEFLQNYMWPLRRWRFRAAMERYKQCREQQKQDEIGQPFYSDAVAVSICAKEILGHLKLR